ncbi:MAG: hypothetical protein WC474_07985 [Hydrogenophilaceae bacterium]
MGFSFIVGVGAGGLSASHAEAVIITKVLSAKIPRYVPGII